MGVLVKLLAGRVLYAVLAALVVGGLTLTLLAMRPSEYMGRVGLLAWPNASEANADNSTPPPSAAEFGSVVSLSLPAVVEIAQSPSLLNNVSASVAGAPAPEVLSKDISVDLVPGSGLARLSVHATSPGLARALTNSVADEIVNAKLLEPSAHMRKLDEPSVNEIEPDWTLAMGLALAAAAAAAVVALGIRALIRPTDRQNLQQALTTAGVEHPVALIQSGGHRDAVSELVVVSEAAGRPVRVLGLGPALLRRAAEVSTLLDDAGVTVARGAAQRDAAVIAIADRRMDPGGLSAILSALPDRAALVAIVVEDSPSDLGRRGAQFAAAE